MLEYKNAFKTKLIKSLKEDIESGNYYLFLGKVDNWPEDFAPAYTDTLEENVQTIQDIISLHKINSNEVFYTKYIPTWISNKYDKFSSNENLKNKQYYVFTNNADGTKDVFICIDNNNKSISTVRPSKSLSNPYELIKTSDNYIWKYLYTISSVDYTTLESGGYGNILPIYDSINSSASVNSTFGSIEKINIIKQGDCFPYAVNTDLDPNYIITEDSLDRIPEFTLSVNSNFSDISREENFYNDDYCLHIHNIDGTLEGIFTIDEMSVDSGSGIATVLVCEPRVSISYAGKIYKILPKIKIIGNGSGAVAYPIMGSGKCITGIEMFSTGEKYFNSTVTVIGDYELEIQFSPTGGIGFDPLYDLNCDEIIITKKIKASGADVYNKLEALSATINSKGFNYFVSSIQKTIPDYDNVTLKQYGIICREPRAGTKNNDFSSDGTQKDEYRGFDVLELYKGTLGSEQYFDSGITEFQPNEFICQTDSSGTIIAWGQVLSIAFYKPTTDPPENLVKFPRIAIKTFYGQFSTSNANSNIKLFDINSRQVTTLTNLKIKSIQQQNIKNDGRGRLLDISNVSAFQITTESDIIFSFTVKI